MLDLKEIMEAVTDSAKRGNPVSRVLMRRKDWDKLLADVRRDAPGEPLNAPEPANRAISDSDLTDCVGLICGVPVLVDDTLDLDTRFVTEYIAE